MVLCAKDFDYRNLNEAIRNSSESCTITDCIGQRFLGAGMENKNITIEGVPGNALGAYLNGAVISVKGNAQDAVGDTMNAGQIVIDGSVGDAAGYAMRGGEIYVKGSAGYRAGIHMKAYDNMLPVMVIGGRTGSFLGEYQAGGLIIVLGLNEDGKKIVGNFTGTGMHGGKIFLRSDCQGIVFPGQVNVAPANEEDLAEIREYVETFCKLFSFDINKIMDSRFTVITPNSKNPYKQMYVAN